MMPLIGQLLALSVEERVDIILTLIASVDGKPIDADTWRAILTKRLVTIDDDSEPPIDPSR